MSPYRFGFEPPFLALAAGAAILYWRAGAGWTQVEIALSNISHPALGLRALSDSRWRANGLFAVVARPTLSHSGLH